MLLFTADSLAQAAPPTNTDRPRIGLVLSGGGARGAAHIGVLKVLEERKVPVDVIVGTSMGAVVGAAYASGMPVALMQTRLESIGAEDILKDDPPREGLTERRKRDDQINFIGPEFGIEGGKLQLPKGAVSGIRLEALLHSLVQQGNDSSFDALPIPFRAVATDIETGEMYVLASGDLVSALRASMSIPGLFTPVELDGRILVDGGLIRNLPVDVARNMGADIVIAVNLGTPLMQRDQITSLLGVTVQMINVLTESNVQSSLAALTAQDILITPELGDFEFSDFDDMGNIVERGEAAANSMAESLVKLAMTPADYTKHRESQNSVADDSAIPVAEIRFVGLNRVNPEVLQSRLKSQVGQPLDTAVLDADLGRIYGRGDFVQVGYSVIDENGRRVLIIELQEKTLGPDYLRFGLGLSNDFAGNAYFQALISYRQTWINSLGAEWRNDLKIGRINQITSEFYQPVNVAQSYFLAPYVDLEQKPYDIFDGNDRVARFMRNTASLGLDAGTEISKIGELRLGVFRGRRNFSLDTGPPALQDSDQAIDIGGARLRLSMDHLDSRQFPRRGYVLSFEVLDSIPTLGAQDKYTRWETDILSAFTSGEHTVQFYLRAGDHFGDTPLPNYDLFQLGGFMQLSGFHVGQLLGQSVRFGRLVYGHRIAKSSLLQGLFGGFSLEAGVVDDPLLSSSPTGVIPAGSIFLATDTPIGPVYLGFGHAQGDNNALYLYLSIP